MFCPKCGAQSPDGSAFCGNCGEIFAVQSQPINQGQPVGQPTYGGQPAVQPQQYGGQPMGQPAQYGAQPVYGQPYGAPGVHTPLDLKKKRAIIIAGVGVCAAVLAAFLIVLFAVIIPGGGAKGKLRHKWGMLEGGSKFDYLDLKNNTMSSGNTVSNITSWDFTGNVLTISAANPTNPTDISTNKCICAFSPDGKTLYLYTLPSSGFNSNISYKHVDLVLSRVD